MVAANRSLKIALRQMQPSVGQLSKQIRSTWTPEEREWRAFVATQKLAALWPKIITQSH